MAYVVMSDTYPGQWGRGETERAAVEEWKRQGGRGPERVVLRIHDAFVTPYIDELGRVFATPGPLLDDLSRRDWPPVIVECWRVKGSRRVPIDPATGQEVAA